jgi:hypothetical protein
MHDAQPVGQIPQCLGETFVGGHRVGPQGVPADRRDDDGMQQRERRRPVDEGDIGVPVIGPGALARVDLLKERLLWRG